MKKTGLYAGVGANLTHYEIDIDALTLTQRGSVGLPSATQYLWPHATLPFLYAAGSSRVAHQKAGSDHHLTVLRTDAQAGTLSLHGEPLKLSHRPVQLSA